MKKSLFFFIALLLQIMAWIPATSRPLAPDYDVSSQLSGTYGSTKNLQAPYSSIQEMTEAESNRGMNELGSRPPNCERKCDGCTPCVATQVPTVTGKLGIQYANYEPISWKCKCGMSFYSP
ncbi:EPIDERMAL PATTERNING FACTOR-like protein 6 isoform X2 [Beta vulgaris subsp. vulgaris]|uniref:EPIDERMAL PATTERNING FACTOR-like protein 6 isoform X2 n=1 Tax=Beta vulgaris subsp. vulgaris TaxID=3555 RepID=UPI0009009C64|nr:EPIDERMAL PATTERNING FACTOR-like protein 6 isoform X2 [Beta vulgaris subsp. vulgaris]